METFTLILERESNFYAAASSIAVSINGGPEDKLSVGNSRTYEVEYRPTNIRFRMGGLGINTIDQTITVNPLGYREMRVRFKPKFKPGITALFSAGNALNYTIIPGERRDAAARPASEAQGFYGGGTQASHAQESPSGEPSARSRSGDFCTQCGTKNPPDANFCGHCGHKLTFPEIG